MTALDEKVTGVLTGMPAMPADVGRNILARLARIEAAIAADMIEEGTILVQYRDLGDDLVVLGMTIKAHFAFLDVSASEEPVAISHGYSFCIGDADVIVAVDRQHVMTPVDQLGLFQAWMSTEKALLRIDEARKLMRTHPAFRNMA